MDGRRVARIRVAPIPGDRPDQPPAEQRAGESADRPAPAEIGRPPPADTGRADGTDAADGATGAAGGQARAEDRGWRLEAGGRADAQDDSATTEGSDGRPEDGRATS
jgi:hypothetical protein